MPLLDDRLVLLGPRKRKARVEPVPVGGTVVLVVELVVLELTVEDVLLVLVVGAAVVVDVLLVLVVGVAVVVDVEVLELVVDEEVLDAEGLPGAPLAGEPEPPQAVSTVLATAPRGDNRATWISDFNSSRRMFPGSPSSGVAMLISRCSLIFVIFLSSILTGTHHDHGAIGVDPVARYSG